MCVALAALDAIVHLQGRSGARTLPFTELHRLPGDHPEIDSVLEPGELITAVELPPLPFAKTSTYRKVRDRASFAFAPVSVAAAMQLDGDRVGIVTTEVLRSKRRYAIVVAFVVAAVLTPPDVISQLALAVPLIGFYEISIIIGGWIEKKRADEDKKAEEAEAKSEP